MIQSYTVAGSGLSQSEGMADGAIWLDLVQPTEAERAEVSARVGFALPSLEDQQEIEHSSRLYVDNSTPVLTALLSARLRKDVLVSAPVTFVLVADLLVTIRHQPHVAFETLVSHPERATLGLTTPARILVGLIEAVVDRLADVTEHVGREIEDMSRQAFHASPSPRPRDYNAALRAIGRQDSEVMLLRESLLSVDRLLGFLLPILADEKRAAHRRALKSCQRDVRTIVDQAGFLTQKTALLLDATLGMIQIEQSEIGKIFSIVATVFLPPTLIASIFGMNFAVMPILDWPLAYPLCLLAMALAAGLPLWWFKRKGWL